MNVERLKKIQLERQRFKDMNEILEEISTVLTDIQPDYITFFWKW